MWCCCHLAVQQWRADSKNARGPLLFKTNVLIYLDRDVDPPAPPRTFLLWAAELSTATPRSLKTAAQL